MKKILIVGAGACMGSVARVLAGEGMKMSDVIIVTPENVNQVKEEIKQNSQFEPEPIPIHAQPPMDDYIPTRKDLEKHPFEKFMGRSRKKW